jgi:hypothetical protein
MDVAPRVIGNAIQQFDIDTASTTGSLRSIKFVAITLAIADIASTIFRALFSTVGSQAPSNGNEIPDITRYKRTYQMRVKRHQRPPRQTIGTQSTEYLSTVVLKARSNS